MINSLYTKIYGINLIRKAKELEQSAVFAYAALATITLVAAAIRFYKLGSWGYWIDEVYTITRAQVELSLDAPISMRLIRLALDIFGVSDWSGRLAPAMVGVVTIPLIYFPVKQIFGTITALLTTLLLALSPWHLFWSQNARFYTVFLLLYFFAQFFFFFWIKSDNYWYLILSGVLLALAVRERVMAVYLAPVAVSYYLGLYLLKFEKPAGFRMRNLVFLGLPVALVLIFLFIRPSVLIDFKTLLLGHHHNPLRVLLSVIYDIGLPLFLLGLLGGIYLVLQKNRAGLYFLIGALVPLMILLLMAPFTTAFSRYVFVTFPNWVILGAFVIKETINNSKKYVWLLALAVLIIPLADAVSQDVLYFGFQNGNREDFKGAFQVVGELKQGGDLIVTGRPEIAIYYLGKDIEVASTEEMKIKTIAKGNRRVWFVVDNRSGITPAYESWIQKNSELIAVRDVYVPGKLFLMRVYLFDPKKGPVLQSNGT